ncbi:MAG TPA: ABC transporter ATP-binding protein, partial [Deltaproteobacteria bacterium]|nr:ABC transporter ATP-binding protein [Deltaproteobacteria bacterium]
GMIMGIIGPNGAGKTTMFNIISGAMRPTSGDVIFKGRKISGLGPARVCRMGIARTYQLVRPFNSLTAVENVLIGLGFGKSRRQSRAERVEDAIRILEFVGLGAKMNSPAEALTLVEKKHLEIARALATSPEILLLDEVVSGLNPTEVGKIVETIEQIRANGVTIVMIEHILKVVMELCDKVSVLNYGVQIAGGTPEEVVRDPKVVDAYIGRVEGAEEKEEKPDA